jgi:hypothetical protein
MRPTVPALLARAILLSVALAAPPVNALPTSVTIAGSLQTELGCTGDWDPACALTNLAYDAEDGVWQASFALPAGSFEYKAAIDGTWDESYGANADPLGASIALPLAAPAIVKLYYDDTTHWVTDDRNAVIAVALGTFQSELGCATDWDPACLRSWLQDPDGDGAYAFTAWLPGGDFEAMVAHAESSDESYGAGGVPGGASIPFSVPTPGREVTFAYAPASHLLEIAVPEPPRATLLAVAFALVAVRTARGSVRSRGHAGGARSA